MPLALVWSESQVSPAERRAVPRPPIGRPPVPRPAPEGVPTNAASAAQPPAGPARPCVEAALARVVGSVTFRHSDRHRAFLSYIVASTLDGRARCLKEVVIGVEVFGRDLATYDPRRDSIVRVEARRLRQKLGRYYAAEGRRDTVGIRVDTGSYVPTFEARVPVADAACGLLAVLPCRTDPADAALARVFADHVVDRIGATTDVRVMAPLAALGLGDAGLDALRREHDVRWVVDGSLARAGDRLRCVLRLARTDEPVPRWSGRFEFDPALERDLFVFQDRIADALSDAVRDAHETPD